LGGRAVQEVVKQIEALHRNEEVQACTVVLSTDLVIRASSVPARTLLSPPTV
jgi:hypothetical protein